MRWPGDDPSALDPKKAAHGLPDGALKELVTGTAATGPSISLPPRQARVFTK